MPDPMRTCKNCGHDEIDHLHYKDECTIKFCRCTQYEYPFDTSIFNTFMGRK